jgi:putative spermidine/putrescine transport system permease protein
MSVSVDTERRPADLAFGWRIVDAVIAIRSKIAPVLSGRWIPYAMLLPALALVGILFYGLGNLAWQSFHSFDAFRGTEGPASLDQYRRIFTGALSHHIFDTIFRTVGLSVAATVTNVTLSLPLAYFIVRIRSNAWRFVALILLLVPFLMGDVVRAFGWYMLLGRHGALTWLLGLFDVHDVRALGTLWAVWLGMIQVGLPIAVLVLLPAMRRINPDLERAAATLGASRWQTWRLIVVPLARPGLASAAIIVWVLSMTEFAMPQVLGLGRIPFVANELDTIFFFQSNSYVGSALALTLLAIVYVGLLLLTRFAYGKARA